MERSRNAVNAQVMQDPSQYLGAEYTEKDFSGGTSQSGAAAVIATLKGLQTTLLENKQASIEKETQSRNQYETVKASKDADKKRVEVQG